MIYIYKYTHANPLFLASHNSEASYFYLLVLPIANYVYTSHGYFCVLLLSFLFPFQSHQPSFSHNAVSNCGDACRTLNDCAGQLICINGRCNDDPNVGTHICSSGDPACKPSGTLNCNGQSHPQYHCSPPVSSSTKAILTLNDFSEGGDGGAASECDEKFHDNSELVVALSTGWYDGGSRCGKMITITANNGKSVKAKVVDECDSVNGCDREHAGQPPCRNNIVDGSKAVWDKLGLQTDVCEVPVTWSMA